MENFDKELFESKVINMVVQYFTAIMKNDLEDVKHFIKEQPLEYGMSIVNDMKEKNRRQMFDELNVRNINILSTSEDDNNYIYDISLEARYLDYQLDLDTGEKVSGDDQNRIMKEYELKIIKSKNAKEQSNIRRCPGCGASLDVNYSGKCPYCGSIYNQEDYDYQILEIR